MSRVTAEIRKCMLDVKAVAGGKVMARFVFPRDFIGFQGHFPERPVLPAVCSIQAALAAVDASSGMTTRLNEIVTAKFTRPISCDEEVVLVYSLREEGDCRAFVEASVARDGDAVGKFRLKVTLQEE